jgi:ethanolamine utilization cobalamin adenosyltransferase
MKQLPIELTQKFAKLIIVSRSQRKFLDNRVVIDLAVEIIRCRNIDGRNSVNLLENIHFYQRKLIKII